MTLNPRTLNFGKPFGAVTGILGRPPVEFLRHPLPIFALFCFGYIALIAAFRYLNFYYTGFEVFGIRVLVYNLLRLAFAGYLFWILYATGDLLLSCLAGRNYGRRPLLDRLALSYFSGAGAWQILLLGLGLANLLLLELVFALTIVVMLCSYRSLVTTFFSPPNEAEAPATPPANGSLQRVALGVMVLILVAVAALLILVKGLYPAGGHDYYTHYFHYYREVVESGSIWPNNVWYHFYYSKGAGLFFLGMLLTDPLAPQLVTLCMMAGAAISIAAFTINLHANKLWQYTIIIVFLGIYIYTPGPRENMAHGGWGDFEKLHEFQTSIVAFLIYALTRLMRRDEYPVKPYRVGAMLATAMAIIITPPFAAFLMFTYFLLGSVALARRSWQTASDITSVAFTCAACVASILVFNYYVTGLPSDQGMHLVWKLVDFEKLHSWGVLPNLVIVQAGLTHLSSLHTGFFNMETARILWVNFRLDLLCLLALLPLPWVLYKALRRDAVLLNYARHHKDAIAVISCFAVAGGVIALLFGRTQSISFYRFSSYLVPVTLMFAAAWWMVALSVFRNRHQSTWGLAVPFLILIMTPGFSMINKHYDITKAKEIIRNAGKLLLGMHSIESAYKTQSSWPGRLPWGGIYPGASDAWAVLPKGERLWSLHTHSYCMTPHCSVESYQSYRLGADWQDVFFGSADDSRAALKKASLNYFLISTELQIVDPLVLGPLFRPEMITKNFGVFWTDGKTALLTWKSVQTKEISPKWLKDYNEKVEESRMGDSYPYRPLERVLRELNETKDYHRLRYLRWDRGLDGMLEPH